MSWMQHNNAPLLGAQAVVDPSSWTGEFRDGQKLRQEYEARQTQKELGKIMQTADHNGRLELARQSRYAGSLIPELQKYEEGRQKAALDNLKASADIGKTYGETGKLGAETGKIGVETQGEQLKTATGIKDYISSAAVSQNPKAFALSIGQLFKSELLTAPQTEGLLNLVNSDPTSAAQVLQAMSMQNPEIAKIFKPESKVLDGKDAAYLYNVNGFTGQANAPDARIAYGHSPDNILDNETSRANNYDSNQTSLANNQNTVAGSERNSQRSLQGTVYNADTNYQGRIDTANISANTASEKTAVDWYKAQTGAAVAQQNANTAATKAQPVVGATGQPVRELAANERTKLFELQEQIDADKGVGESLKKLNNLVDQAYSGAGASFRGTFMSRIPGGGSNERANATVLSENIATELALKQLKSTFGAAPTEGERKILMDLQASVDKTPAQKKLIIASAMRAVAERLRYRNDQMEGIRTGRYAVPTGYNSKQANKPTTQNKQAGKGGAIIGSILGGN